MSRTTRRTRLMSTVVLVPLALGLVACGADDDDNDDVMPTPAAAPASTEASTETSPSEQSTQATQAAGTIQGDVETAVATALAELDGTVFSVDGDTLGWDVAIVTANGDEFDIQLAPDAASVTRGATQEMDDADDVAERERLLGVSVDYAAAIAAASAQVQGTVTGVELSEDDGRAVWDVQFDEDTPTEQTVDIDAQTGDVLVVEQDD